MERTNSSMGSERFHFLAGLPRSGNTLLSALLNQHPSIYSSPLSPMPSLLFNAHQTLLNSDAYARNKENQIRGEKVIKNLMTDFYSDVKKPIIIDRDKAWGTPANLELIKQCITDKPKIIFTVRDILEIIASFITISPNFVKSKISYDFWYKSNYMNEADLMVEALMQDNEDIQKCLLSLSSAFLKENKGIFHIVEYKDIVDNTQHTMDKIYIFLGVEPFKNNLTNIKKIENDNDIALNLPKTLHNVNKSIVSSKTQISTISSYMQKKYGNMEFWRDNNELRIRGKNF